MPIIRDQDRLEDLCAYLKTQPYMTIDTEFLRDKTYYPRLCLVQLCPPKGKGEAVALDPFIDLDWSSFYDLLFDEKLLKVFHAGRQDVEIFYHLTGKIVWPVFDTQIAAMVCGYGQSVGFSNLVSTITGKTLDKGAQFTDWSQRPLDKKQIQYALNDVIYLRDIYEDIAAEIERRGRGHWVWQEEEILLDPATYDNPDEEAWTRIKLKTNSLKSYAVLREVCAWREREAKKRDVPRARVLRDDTMIDLAQSAPRTPEALGKIRNIPGDIASSKHGQAILSAVQCALEMPKSDYPELPKPVKVSRSMAPFVDMLRLLLRVQAGTHDVAAKLIATKEDLEAIAMNKTKGLACMRGWRYEIFGRYAKDLRAGHITIGMENGQPAIIQMQQGAALS